MIIKNKETVSIHWWKIVGGEFVQYTATAVYRGAVLIWQGIRSCFGSGHWVGAKPWLGKEGWKGN